MKDMTSEDFQRVLDAAKVEVAKIEAEAVPLPPEEPTPPIPLPPDTFTPEEARAFLNGAGLEEVTDFVEATKRYQEAYNLGDALAVDGDFGPKTTAAAKVSMEHPDPITKYFRASEHFCLPEFKCKAKVHSTDCKRTRVFRRTLKGLEAYREERKKAGLGNGVAILSGYRDIAHNKAVGGKPSSQHLKGMAVDPTVQNVPLSLLLSWNLPEFCGIGYNPDKTVSHLDSRPAPRVTFAD